MWFKYTVEYYAAEKNNDIMKFTGKWMELENVILSESTDNDGADLQKIPAFASPTPSAFPSPTPPIPSYKKIFSTSFQYFKKDSYLIFLIVCICAWMW
ncbi:hypothetical protein STEG23_036081, partial [Scotinomys teguina]